MRSKKSCTNELHRIENLQKKLDQFTPETVDRKIRNKWMRIKAEKSAENLKKLPGKEGFPVEQLLQEGIKTIYSARVSE